MAEADKLWPGHEVGVGRRCRGTCGMRAASLLSPSCLPRCLAPLAPLIIEQSHPLGRAIRARFRRRHRSAAAGSPHSRHRLPARSRSRSRRNSCPCCRRRKDRHEGAHSAARGSNSDVTGLDIVNQAAGAISLGRTTIQSLPLPNTHVRPSVVVISIVQDPFRLVSNSN